MLRVVRRALQLLHARSATAPIRERFDRYWPVDYHLVGKDILRFHAVYWPAMLMAAGLEPPKCVFAHGWLLVGGEKMSKTRANQIAPAELVADFGVDGFRYHFLGDQRFGPDGDFSYEAMVARYNADLANNFGNLANRVLNMAVNYCGGVVPDTRDDGPLVDAAAAAFDGAHARHGDARLLDGFGAVWDLIRDANSYIEDRQPWALNKAGDSVAAAAVLGDCLEALRIVALLASPLIPRASAELWRRLGLPGTPDDAATARTPRGGGSSPRGRRLEKGAPLFPRRDVEQRDRGSTPTATCPSLDRRTPTPRSTGPAAAGVDADGVRRHRPRRLAPRDRARRRARRRRGDRRAAPARRVEARRGVGRRSMALASKPAGRRRRRGRVRPLLRALAGRRAGSGVPRADRSSRNELGLALVIHTRDAWDDTFRVLEDAGVPERTVFHCFTGGPDEARRALVLGAYLSFSGIVSFKNADDVRAAAVLTPIDRMLVETDAPYLAPVPHRGKRERTGMGRRRRRRARGRDRARAR